MKKSDFGHARKWAAAALLGALAWVGPVLAETSSETRDAPVAEISREAVWRAIFARPHGVSASAVGDTAAQIELGRDLFRDPRLSGSGKAACTSCHDPDHAFTDGRRTAVGPGGAVLPRNAPALYNLAWAVSFFWDGRAPTLAAQARFPILAEDELAGDFTTIAQRLSADPAVKAHFATAFPEAPGVTESAILDALAAYERSLVSAESRFDRWIAGDGAALTETELQGFDIFVGKGGCVSCHGGWRFTDDNFHDIGLASQDLGRGALVASAKGLPQFKTPSLREVARTAPYMHDGSLATLEDVVAHYTGNLIKRPSLAATVVRDLELTAEEKAALVAFLKTLSGEPESHVSDETTRPMLKK